MFKSCHLEIFSFYFNFLFLFCLFGVIGKHDRLKICFFLKSIGSSPIAGIYSFIFIMKNIYSLITVKKLCKMNTHLVYSTRYPNFFFNKYLIAFKQKTLIINIFLTLISFFKLLPFLQYYIKNKGSLFFVNDNYELSTLLYTYSENTFNYSLTQVWRPGLLSNTLYSPIIHQRKSYLKQFFKNSIIFLIGINEFLSTLLKEAWQLQIPIILYSAIPLYFQKYITYIIPGNSKIKNSLFFFLSILITFIKQYILQNNWNYKLLYKKKLKKKDLWLSLIPLKKKKLYYHLKRKKIFQENIYFIQKKTYVTKKKFSIQNHFIFVKNNKKNIVLKKNLIVYTFLKHFHHIITRLNLFLSNITFLENYLTKNFLDTLLYQIYLEKNICIFFLKKIKFFKINSHLNFFSIFQILFWTYDYFITNFLIKTKKYIQGKLNLMLQKKYLRQEFFIALTADYLMADELFEYTDLLMFQENHIYFQVIMNFLTPYQHTMQLIYKKQYLKKKYRKIQQKLNKEDVMKTLLKKYQLPIKPQKLKKTTIKPQIISDSLEKQIITYLKNLQL